MPFKLWLQNRVSENQLVDNRKLYFGNIKRCWQATLVWRLRQWRKNSQPSHFIWKWTIFWFKKYNLTKTLIESHHSELSSPISSSETISWKQDFFDNDAVITCQVKKLSSREPLSNKNPKPLIWGTHLQKESAIVKYIDSNKCPKMTSIGIFEASPI